ncbi:DNA replication/repair protein RecF [Schaalia sp. lx-100]|uniref:DNA replication/repair protein RecF n=1 Tax=Schaalia sp. lx-100 TaxID=2899081 RepID=UPI001E3A4173|nr:DNA replication/repair protein RecF [Schaalia sp. lx-100]
MRISHVAVDDFRSYRHAVVEFPQGTTVLLGPNGQGKTNLVEAIAYLSTFTSHRISAENALVRVPHDPSEQIPAGAVIRVKAVYENNRNNIIELEIVRGKANRARLDRNNARPRDILAMVRTVVFAPEDLQLVRGDPSVRRTFMDDLAIQLQPLISQIKVDFDKVARQRAALMKSAQAALRRGKTPDLSTIDVWDERFAELSARLTAARARAIRLLASPAASAHDHIAQSGRAFTMAYDASVDRALKTYHQVDHAFSSEKSKGIPETSSNANFAILNTDSIVSHDLEDVSVQTERMKYALTLMRDHEVERGVNLVGAHRDDVIFSLGHMPVKGYASHGESWSVALGLRLGAFEVLSADGERPILILDDVFAELDAIRRDALADFVQEAEQVLITAAVADDVPKALDAHVLHVHFDADDGTVVTS